jgi:hypothetical protein
MDSYSDRYGDTIVVSPNYIRYRNRLIDRMDIMEIRVVGKKFLINSFKQNVLSPTMCIHMESHDEALGFYDEVINQFYDEDEPVVNTHFLDWLFKSD